MLKLNIQRVVRGCLIAGLLLWTPAASAELSGTVFQDRDGDGVRNSGERGVAGVLVSNGRDVVRTDDAGHYSLPDWVPDWKIEHGIEPEPALVYLSRRDDFESHEWYRKREGRYLCPTSRMAIRGGRTFRGQHSVVEGALESRLPTQGDARR